MKALDDLKALATDPDLINVGDLRRYAVGIAVAAERLSGSRWEIHIDLPAGIVMIHQRSG